jgi:hypothetical protein
MIHREDLGALFLTIQPSDVRIGHSSPMPDDSVGRQRRPVPTTWVLYRDAARMFLRGATIRSAALIAAVVGTWLSLLNQGTPILDGHPPWFKILLNYATPFVVASLGFLAARRRRNVERLISILGENGDRSDD